MQVTETVAEGLKREFTVVIPAQSFKERIETRLKDRQRSMRLPGFRPGKVPMALVAKHWRQQVTGEELQSTIGDSSAQIVSDRGLRPAGQPKIEITNFSDGADLEYKMALELLPEIEPMDLSQLELTRTDGRGSRRRDRPGAGAPGDRPGRRASRWPSRARPPRTMWWWPISSAASTGWNSKAARPRVITSASAPTS